MTDVTALTKAFNNAANRLPTMWELGLEWNRLLSLLEDPEANPAEVQTEMQKVAGDIRVKGHGVAIVLKALDDLARVQRDNGQILLAKARVNETHAERLRTYALTCMQSLGIDRLETGTHTLSVRTNPPSVHVVDEDAVPSEFVRVVMAASVNKAAILAHVKVTGEIPEGVTVERSQSLRIT